MSTKGQTTYQVVSEFKGYQHKKDQTNLPPGVLVVGSQNVLFNTGERVAARPGYTLDGQANAANFGIQSSFDWFTHLGTERNLRAYNDILEYRYVDEDGVVTWEQLADGFSSVAFNFDVFWDTNEQLEQLLFVNGTSNIFSWSGGIGTLASSSFAAGSVSVLNPVPTAAGTTYGVGQILTITTGGTGATALITSVDGGGGVTGVTLISPGTGYTTGAGKVTTVNVGAGTGCTLDITTIATGFIELNGDLTIGQLGFLSTDPNQAVVINGNTYTYTQITPAGNFFVGINADPTGEPVDSIVVQAIITTPNSSMTDIPNDFPNALIAILYNQVYIGSLTSNEVYVSEQNSFVDYSFSSPRAPGEGALITLDAPPIGFQAQEDFMYIGAGRDFWYQISFTLSADQALEAVDIKRLKTTSLQAPQSQALITKMKNDVAFVDNEPSFNTLGRVEFVETPQTTDISDIIELDFNQLDFTGGHAFYFRNFIYISVPTVDLVYIYNMQYGFWESPQVLPIKRFAVIGGELYGHSAHQPETYKLFNGSSDNGKPIKSVAAFSYMNFGQRANKKQITEWYTEGYIKSNTSLTLQLLYDYKGSRGNPSYLISGSENGNILFVPVSDGSLGKKSLGKFSLAGRGDTQSAEDLLIKFRVCTASAGIANFFEIQPIYSSNNIDQSWELLAIGCDVTPSVDSNFDIRQ